jgi:hypothetical protein
VALALAGTVTVVAVGDIPAVSVEIEGTTCDGFGRTCTFDGCVAVDIGLGLEVNVGFGVGLEVDVGVGLGVGVGVGLGVGVGVGLGVGVGVEEQKSKKHPPPIGWATAMPVRPLKVDSKST